MKTILLLLIIAFCLRQEIFSQNIGINSTGAAPHPSAMLDVSAAGKGMLVPRTSAASRIAIVNPAKGLLLYDTTSSSFWYHNGTNWVALSPGPGSPATNYWSVNGTHISNNNTGNVGIGTNNPTAKLTLQTAINTEGFRHIGGTDSIIVTEGIGGVSASIGTVTNHTFRLNAGGQGRMSISPTGDVVVGDNSVAPFSKFSVATLNNSYGISHLGEGGNILATQMGGTSAGIGTFSHTNMRIFSNGVSRMLIAEATGNIGIGTDNPTSKLQIGSLGAVNLNGNDFAIGNGSNAMSIFQSNTATSIASSTDIVFHPRLNNGNMGINVDVPANKLQIGSMGPAGFNGNDLAIGNGSQAMVVYQSDNSTLLASTTDIILKPRNNDQGRVGINTSTPRAPLDVAGISAPAPLGIQYSYMNDVTYNNGVGHVSSTTPVPNISIIASGNVYAHEFDAYSDARIKEVAGVSNASTDLETVNALQVKDYTMKDKVMYGNKSFKKVIAQEVEKIYPQVVSKHTDFIPNVYQLSGRITKTADGYLIDFTRDHHISSHAKKIQAIISDEGGMQQFDIVAIPSANEVVINAPDIKSDKVFVYGEEVDDFRTVDYEGLTTLHISATQEISRLVKKQAATISRQQKQLIVQQVQMKLLEKRVEALESKPVTQLP